MKNGSVLIAKDRLNGINQKNEMNLFYQEEYEQMNLFEGENDGNT